MRGAQPQEEKKKMARSSIACARCRRSKVKCVNAGVDSVCKACEVSGRECTYPPSGATITPKRSEPTPGIKVEESEGKRKIRKTDEFTRRNPLRTGEDVLDAPILTKAVYRSVWTIFKRHFSTEMCFLHPSFVYRLDDAANPRDPSLQPTVDPEGTKLLLLAMLTLTARFHPELVAHHSSGRPIGASEYYGNALVSSNGLSGNNLATPSLERIQALLMLGLYEWDQSKGGKAWFHVGAAIRLAQLMELSYEDDVEHAKFNAKRLTTVSSHDKEVRRRTMWSCFVMDRMLSCGKYRDRMVNIGSLKLRLPCSDHSFLHGKGAAVGFLHDQIPNHDDDAILSRYIRLVSIWGEVSIWSHAGGRRTETHPPWEEASRFFQLREMLLQFRKELPEDLAMNQEKLRTHILGGSGNAYTSLHTLNLISLIMLHREYIPHIALRCQKPDGPIDAPIFSKDQYNIPEGFWEDSADVLFRSARDIVDIVQSCRGEENALPESAQIVFALFSAAYCGVYAASFPQMDTAGHMLRPDHEIGSNGVGYSGLVIKILKEMAPRIPMAAVYVKKLNSAKSSLQAHKQHYLTKREMPFAGGGLEEYKSIERELKDFGSLEDSNGHYSNEDSGDRSRASTNETNNASMNGEPMQGLESQSQQPRSNGAWPAVNTLAPSIEADDRQKSFGQGQGTSGFQFGYQRSPSNTPNNVYSHGDAATGLNSPFGRSDQSRLNDSRPIVLAPINKHRSMGPPGLPEPESDSQFNQWLASIETNDTWDMPGFDDFAQVNTEQNFAGDLAVEQHRVMVPAWAGY